MSKEAVYTNRLIREKSPYLLQHAHNPVNWYPWGEEAFEAARNEQKPIFLSIGYSTCHWCHVMERESFEDPKLASLMNEVFINIKVDREELPEIDSLYMEFAQSMIAGASGWPLNVVLTPELNPFFAVTYLPPYQSKGLMGLSELIQRIHEAWGNLEERERLEMQSHQILQIFAKNVHVQGEILLQKEEIAEGAELLFKMADSVYGGMKGEPKFPMGYYMNFLLRYSGVSKDSRALFIAERTLDMMHRGGIYDHLGGGFSRYSVDEKWFLPHFEKMLYDNAILVKAYFEAWQATKKELYRVIQIETFNYILRDMMHKDGGFYSAEDADSEGVEGLFYTWTYENVINILGDEGELFCEYYDISPQGNFNEQNILHIAVPLGDFAKRKGKNVLELEEFFKMQRLKLWQAREKRVHPHKDKKIIAAWNGLVIDALANAADPKDSQKYLATANQSAAFIQKHFWVDHRLKRRWCDGEVSFEGGLEDYAFMLKGILSLFEQAGDVRWLQWAIELCNVTNELFKSPQGAYFQTSEEEENIILRKSQYSDGAEPSGNSIQCENLIRLYDITGQDHYLEAATDIMKAAERYITNYPAGYIYHLMNFNRYYDLNRATIVIALNKEDEHREFLKQIIHDHFIPHKSVIWRTLNDERLFDLLPATREQEPIDGKTTVYICHQGVCKKPLNDIERMEEALRAL